MPLSKEEILNFDKLDKLASPKPLMEYCRKIWKASKDCDVDERQYEFVKHLVLEAVDRGLNGDLIEKIAGSHLGKWIHGRKQGYIRIAIPLKEL